MDIFDTNKPSYVAILVGFAVCCTSYTIWFYHKRYQYFEKLGIKGPKPTFLVGNVMQMTNGKDPTTTYQQDWFDKYGKIYGVFLGSRPCISISDVDVVRDICVKNFDIFPNHFSDDIATDFELRWLPYLLDDEWRRMRAIMTPTFTSAKIRRMYGLLDKCSDDLIDICKEQLTKDKDHPDSYSAIVNAREIHSVYALDTIVTCFFGLKLKRASGVKSMEDAASKDEIAKIFVGLFERRPLRLLIGKLVPMFILNLIGFKSSPANKSAKSITQKIVDARRKSNRKFEDYLQVIMDARLGDELEFDQRDETDNYHVGFNQEILEEGQREYIERETKAHGNARATLDDFEILSGALLMIYGGVETTATTLSKCIYALAYHPEVEEKLYQAVKQIAKYDSNNRLHFDYDELSSCAYLDSLIWETLRCTPVITVIDRIALRDYYVKKYDFTIPKGMMVFLSSYSMQRDPDYWEEPEKFDPDRFMPENRDKIIPASYIPFGYGPRHCVGMRFSLIESKLSIAKAVMSFKFSPVEGLKFPPVLDGNIGLSNMKDPRVKIMPRN